MSMCRTLRRLRACGCSTGTACASMSSKGDPSSSSARPPRNPLPPDRVAAGVTPCLDHGRSGVSAASLSFDAVCSIAATGADPPKPRRPNTEVGSGASPCGGGRRLSSVALSEDALNKANTSRPDSRSSCSSVPAGATQGPSQPSRVSALSKLSGTRTHPSFIHFGRSSGSSGSHADIGKGVPEATFGNDGPMSTSEPPPGVAQLLVLIGIPVTSPRQVSTSTSRTSRAQARARRALRRRGTGAVRVYRAR